MKKFIVSSFAAIALIAGTSAYAATAKDMGTSTIGYKSPMMYVQNTQENLNVCAGATPALVVDGKYGSKTTMAAKTFQMAKGLTVDGKIGPMTKAALIAACGGTTTTTTTAGLCPNGMTLASNCTVAPAGTTTVSGTEGYLADFAFDSGNRVSTVYESETNKVVAGFRATARLADQKVEAVKVTFKNSNVASSANLAKYATSVSLMKDGTVLKTMTIAEADRSNTDDTYTFQFTGLGSAISKDTIGRYYVAVNANGALDSVDATNASWDVKFIDVRSTSPNGVYLVNSSSPFPIAQLAVKFGKFSSSGVKAEVALATSNPTAGTKEVSETADTNGITLMTFKATARTSDMTLRNVPITIAKTLDSVIAVDNTNVINTVKLMKGTELVDSLPANVSGVYVFSNLSSTANKITAGSSAEYSVVVDVKRQKNGLTDAYSNGTTLEATFTSVLAGTWSVQDVNGDQIVTRSGSAAGEKISLASKGVLLSKGTTSTQSSGGNTPTGTWKININVTAVGDTIYVADIAAATLADLKDTAGVAAATPSISIAPASGSTISKSGTFYVINSGETKSFTVTVSKQTTAGVQYRAIMNTFTYKVGSTGAADSTTTANLNTYATDFFAL